MTVGAGMVSAVKGKAAVSAGERTYTESDLYRIRKGAQRIHSKAVP